MRKKKEPTREVPLHHANGKPGPATVQTLVTIPASWVKR